MRSRQRVSRGMSRRPLLQRHQDVLYLCVACLVRGVLVLPKEDHGKVVQGSEQMTVGPLGDPNKAFDLAQWNSLERSSGDTGSCETQGRALFSTPFGPGLAGRFHLDPGLLHEGSRRPQAVNAGWRAAFSSPKVTFLLSWGTWPDSGLPARSGRSTLRKGGSL